MSQDHYQNPFDAIHILIMEMTISMAIQEVAHLGIADLLRDGPKPVSLLAQEAGVHADVLQLYLRVLSSKDIFVEKEIGIFDNTERSRCLQADIPSSMHSMAELFRSAWMRTAHTPEALAYTLQTGQPAIDHVLGENMWSYLTNHLSDAKIFNAALTGTSHSHSERIAQACDLTGQHTLVDLGGGEGGFLLNLLRLHPETTGILYDIPSALEKAPALIAESGLADRCTYIAGDLLQSIPAGGDAYFMKQVLHDWSDEECLRILRNCREAMGPNGKLFIIEYIIPDPPEKPSPYLALSITLRQLTPGYQRTEQQFRHLLNEAGLAFVSRKLTNAPSSVLEAKVVTVP